MDRRETARAPLGPRSAAAASAPQARTTASTGSEPSASRTSRSSDVRDLGAGADTLAEGSGERVDQLPHPTAAAGGTADRARRRAQTAARPARHGSGSPGSAPTSRAPGTSPPPTACRRRRRGAPRGAARSPGRSPRRRAGDGAARRASPRRRPGASASRDPRAHGSVPAATDPATGARRRRRPGSRTRCPRGSGTRPGVRPEERTGRARRDQSSARGRRQRSAPQGFRAARESGPGSSDRSPTSTGGATTPPWVSSRSNTRGSAPARWRWNAVASPATPPPTTATRPRHASRASARWSRTTSARTSRYSGSAFGIVVRANRIPAPSATAFASMSRS